MTEEDELAEALAQEEIRDVTVDTVLSHEARHGHKEFEGLGDDK
jgi:hypothetical protein